MRGQGGFDGGNRKEGWEELSDSGTGLKGSGRIC